ncbi:hypothetical protein TTHERM_00431270 (macronuclear) [Tetrahymena thermophila SB210]|uniref:Uncharacterized protein n=1 Tax=Tetrahymena thermophila (strain SB210) TaxID=312017 RepID=Q231D2_TETTS|nr:hypothetical protein TTHERM_00431270 [Tetrahymena thermophila SB210]EAR91107.2 hypothetical protein TTHERM_00431270 [Tetrahymena thermophila SB210]|eukprot:XP_001011352.2 hypothetical protein TTHERM_00431270 [Tetrahymena thermophila SB210]
MRNNNQHTLSKFPWFYCQEWDFETFRICLEQLGISDQMINTIQINSKGVQNILNEINNQNALEFLRNTPLFDQFTAQFTPCEEILEFQERLLMECNCYLYEQWRQEDLEKFAIQLQLDINWQQHQTLIKQNSFSSSSIQQNIDTFNTQDCKIYKQWIKYIEQENRNTIQSESQNTQLVNTDEQNIAIDNYIQIFSNQQILEQIQQTRDTLSFVSATLKNVEIFVAQQQIGVNVDIQKFNLSNSSNICDFFGQVKLKSLKLKNQEGIESNLLHLQFNTLQKNLYYQVFSEKLVIGDEIFIQQCLIHIVVTHQQYSVETQTMSYTLIFYFEKEGRNIVISVDQNEGETKVLGRYSGNNSPDILHFTHLEELKLDNLSRNLALLEVKNQNLYIRWNYKKGKKIWKRIKQNNLILVQPFINIRCNSINSIMIFQGLNNQQISSQNSKENHQVPPKIEINQLSKYSTRIQKFDFSLGEQAKYFEINSSKSVDKFIENYENGQIINDQIEQYFPNIRYFFNATNDNIQHIINNISDQ